MRARILATLATLSGAAVACTDVAVTESVDLPTVPPRFSVSAHFVSSPPESASVLPYWLISASASPGLVQGLLREIDDTMWIDGEPYLPDQVASTHRWYTVSLQMPFEELHERTHTIVPPAVEGFAPPRSIGIVGIGRAGGDTIRWTAGSDLVFPLALPAALPDPPPLDFGWSLSVIQGETSLSLRGLGLPPEDIVIPGVYFTPADSPFVASFAFDIFGRDPSDDRDAYVVTYGIVGRFDWVVLVEGSP